MHETITADLEDVSSAIIVPLRPALQIKGVVLERVFSSHVAHAWSFGESDVFEGLYYIARDQNGAVINTNCDALFPGDFEADADYQRLMRYTNIIEEESFVSFAGEPLPSFVSDLGSWTIERPTVANVSVAAKFDLKRLRLWRTGNTWDGFTLLGDAIADGLMQTDEYEQTVVAATARVQKNAIEQALAPFPNSAELLSRLYPGPTQ